MAVQIRSPAGLSSLLEYARLTDTWSSTPTASTTRPRSATSTRTHAAVPFLAAL
ncbi:MAG: hypothetical protein H0V67_00535 [Geodermatophilaceae bacterium]|nr:hypothetical protein [Geodermatophilaceae bacterium]